ncbi:MAG: DUF6265 family protein [Pseudomonadales bacterium]|jgi:hypothetical protein|nr:DUF6265 family protein [Pseudomonadales bacterium]
MPHLLAGLCLLALGAFAAAEPVPFTAHTLRGDAGDAAPPATIAAMAWLAGRWRTAAFGGTGEETWLPPAGGAMAGVYRQQGDAGVSFYEILVIRQLEGTLLLQLRHFDSALVAWEAPGETVDFPLVAVEPDAMHFEGMSFHRLGADAMRVYLAVDDGAGEVRFDYERF